MALKKFKSLTKKQRLILAIAAAVLLVAAVTVTLILVLGGGKDPTPDVDEWSETGVYYFDAKYDEYTLTLSEGDTFALVVKGEIAFGSYTLEDGALTLDFNLEGKENATATLDGDVITLTYGESTMRLLKKVNYTVTFETNGGETISPATVINGKTVAKPADPTRDGFIFIGWYADAKFSRPFTFESQTVTADTTIYARWSDAGSASTEYSVKFDLGYSGAASIDPLKTKNGKVYDLPIVTRADYDFGGWWVSMLSDPEKLTYECTEGTELNSGTTLYALWIPKATASQKLPAPLVTVKPASVSWGAVNGARSYTVRITNASGTVVFESDTSNTTVNVPFDTYAAGEYAVRVTALANSGDSNNSECTRYFVNKSLAKVSIFNVIEPATLNFNTVPGAEKYLISVVCGNPDHNHTNFDNGLSRTFSFANCEMTADGIQFTVTAVADGYASSISEVFTYKRALDAVDGLRIDEAAQTVHWNEVRGASSYMVSVKCGNATHDHGFVNCGSALSVSIKECSVTADGITVKVYPVTKGYISPDATEIKFNKINLATPSDITVSGLTLTWSAVAGAAKYEIKIGGKTYESTSESFGLSDVIDLVEGTKYAVSIRAIGETESLWSDEVRAVYLEKPTQLSYYGSIFKWNPVIGATGYEVQVNDGTPVAVDSGVTSTKITLTKPGVNEIKVRFVDGADRSEWAIFEVFAHTIIFDTRGGSQIAPQYKGVGDEVTLPTPTKSGYDFVAWYNVPGGPLSNGRIYTDKSFSESGSIVLYAYYTAVAVDVTLSVGAEAGGDKLPGKISFEEHYRLEIPMPLSPTMAFGGWYSAPYGMGNRYTDHKGNSLAPWDSLESVELHAYWIDYALQFTLTKVNGADAYMVSAGERIAMLEEVTVPVNFNNLPVAMVAGNAFKNCTSLKVINLPSTLAEISLVEPFSGCTSLEAVNVYNVDRGTDSRYWSDNGVLFDNGTASTAQPKLLFMPLAKTGSYRIPEGVREIPQNAFSNSSLSRITVPASVTKIGAEAFASCTKLTSITFGTAKGEEPLTIGKRAFLGCVSLEKITLPARLSDISLTKYTSTDSVISLENADNAFLGCSALTSIHVASANAAYKSVDGVLYSRDGKTLLYCPISIYDAFDVPVGTQTIAPGAFVGCYGISGVTIPNTVTTIGDYAFYGLTVNLTAVTFGGNGFNDVAVGKYAFSGCSKLSEINFEPGSRINTIDEGAFYGCAITELTIPNTVTKIGKNAFYNCAKLESISFAKNGKPLTFEEGVFSGCSSLTSVHIPANVSEIPGIFSGCISLLSVTVDEDSPYFASIDGVVFDKEKTAILFFPQGKTGEYTLPASVTAIADGVFSYVNGITKLTLPNTLSSIGDGAFSYSYISEIVFTGTSAADSLDIGNEAFKMTPYLRRLTLPAHTKSLGDRVFEGSAIEHLTLNEGLEQIGAYAFTSTYNLFTLTIPGSVNAISDYCFSSSRSIQELTLSEGIQSIGKYAFENCAYISGIKIPASVTRIDDYAFAGPYLSTVTFAQNSNLETIGAYAFTRSQIASIVIPKSVKAIGAYAFYNCTALKTVTFEDGGTDDLVIGTPYVYTHKDDYTDTMVTEILVGHVFANARNLTSVAFPARLTEIKANSFESAGSNAGSLAVSFGQNSRLTTIGEYCFYDSALTSIIIPSSVCNLDPVINDDFGLTYDRLGIGAYAFKNADKLESVAFELSGTAPLTIGKGAFLGAVNLGAITLPKRIAPYTSSDEETISGLEGGAGVFAGATSLSSVIIEDGGNHYADIDGILYTADLTELIFCPPAYVGEVTVPSSVTKIADKAFYGCVGATSIRFEGGDEDMVIGSSAFAGCEGITEIVLPPNAVSLGEKAFSGCTRLESITLSKHIDRFEGSMIENCPALKNIIVEEGGSGFYYENGALYSSDKTVLILYTSSSTQTSITLLPTTKKILNNAFAGNTYLTEVILPAGLSEIGASAFAGCTKLSTIVIPNTVEIIAESAFANCPSLAYPEFEKGGTAKLVIGNLAFSGSGLHTVELPSRTSSLGDRVFASSALEQITFEANSALESMGNCVFEDTDIKEIILPEGLITIGDSTFEGTRITRVTLPASLKTMGINTFRLCKSLTEVIFSGESQIEILPAGTFSGSSIVTISIPASVTLIQNKEEGNSASYGVFESCTSLKSVSFSAGGRLAEIGHRAFHGCTALEEIILPSSVSTVGFMAFYKCTALVSVTIPEATTALGHSMFYGCENLKNVTLLSKTTTLPEYMFYNCSSLASITIPSNVTTIGEDCFYGTGLEEIFVAAGNTAYASRDGILYSGDFSEILICPPKHNKESITIPKEVTSIGSDIFTGIGTIKQIIFEDGGSQSLTIAAYAFENCYQLHTVLLPERLESIGTSAFGGCASLTSITIPSTLKRIDDYAFLSCYKLVEVYNKSSLNIKVDTSNGYVGYYALNIYTPESGESIVSVDENGYVTATVNSVKYLVGYIGNEKKLTLPSDFDAFYGYTFYRLDTIESIVIPSGAGDVSIGKNVFASCGAPILLFEDSAVPTAWGNLWNGDNCTVILGYDGEEHTYSFVTGSSEIIESIKSRGSITLPTPEPITGKVFVGWSTSSDLSGTPLTGSYYSIDKTVLYAVWRNEGEEIPAEPDGTGFDTAFDLPLAESNTVLIDSSGKAVYFKFTPAVSGIYHAFVSGNSNSVLKIWINPEGYAQSSLYADSSKPIIDADLFEFSAGTTYYFSVSLSSAETAELAFILSLTEETGNTGGGTGSEPTSGGTSFDDAIELELDKEEQASVAIAGNKVYFSFTPATTDKYNIDVYGYSATLNIYGSDKTTPIETLTDTSGSINKDMELTEGVTYYFVLHSQNNNFVTYITVEVATEDPGAGGTTPGGDASTGFDDATSLSADGTITVQFTSANQAIYYVYTAARTGDHRILLDSGFNYSSVKIYDANKSLLQGPVYDNFGRTDITQAMTEGETYYIVISMLYSTGSLQFTFSSPTEDEPGGGTELVGGTGFDDAIEITLGETYNVPCDTQGKKFYFKYTAAATGVYHAYVSGSTNSMIQVWKDTENTHQSPIYANWGTGLIDKDLSSFTEGTTYYIVVSVSGSTADLEFILTAQTEQN